MTDGSLKAVLSLDPETSTYKPLTHNLTAEQAVEEMQKQTSSGFTVRIADQECRHKTVNSARCKSCKTLIHRITERNESANTETSAQEEGIPEA